MKATPLVLHGHFYQPPRENPWTEIVYRQPSAEPFHDWNERVHRECYRANAYARIFDDVGRVQRIVNNYALLSFNFGPTLLRWMEQADPDTYARILDADRASRALRGGHGNAIAQAYNHAILPLCNARDRLTQIRWGAADFRRRFGREPEGMWLPETACDTATIDDLIDEGVGFTVLSPHQARRARPTSGAPWTDVSDGSIDPGRAYRCRHSDGSGRWIALFFYDGQLAHSMAFERVLHWGDDFIARIEGARTGDGLVHAATDGESFGHHRAFGDRVLAYTLEVLARARGFQVTNYGQYLEENPPTWEVELKAGPQGEGTAWSCAHGVGRWARDCGCSTGGQPGWNQAWRAPLRRALDFLRDEAARAFDEIGGQTFRDPWAVRDDYIDVVLDRGRTRESFLQRHGVAGATTAGQERALVLLEMQRNALLMYTSCGWFFADLGGIETVQVLNYAGRVLDRLEQLDRPAAVEGFLERLAEARSNDPHVGTGADIYRQVVEPQRVSATRMVASVALMSLVDTGEAAVEQGCYVFQRRNWQAERYGRLTLATGRIVLEETSTGRLLDCAVAALHLGGIDFYCVTRPFPDLQRFHEATRRLWDLFHSAPLARLLISARELFGPDEYGLEHMLPDAREHVSSIVFGELVEHFSLQYAHLYDNNQRLLDMLQSAGFRLPPELRAAADFTMSHRFEEEIRRQRGVRDPGQYREAIELAERIAARGYQIDGDRIGHLFGATIDDAVQAALESPQPEALDMARALVELAPRLGVHPDLGRAQDAAWAALQATADPKPELLALAAALNLAPELVAVPGRTSVL